MTTSLQTRLLSRIEPVRDFFGRRIWEVRLDGLPTGKAVAYRAARIGYGAVHALLFSDRLHVRAAALTYYSVLSLVPLLAFVFALLKGFGAYDTLIEQRVRPYVLDTFQGNPALRRAVEQVLGFVSDTEVASLGAFGLALLLYTSTRLLRNIEGAFNELWQVARARTLFEQLRDYVAIIVITPLCLLLAAAAGTGSRLAESLRRVPEHLGLGGLFDWAFGTLGPLFIAFAGFGFLYRVMPNTPVRTRSALVGAALGSLLWFAALVAHVHFQLGVARFNALYAGFGAIPIFLVWLHVSWLAVMVGAEAAATHQYAHTGVQRLRGAEATMAVREALCLSAMLSIARALIEGGQPPGLRALCSALNAPEPLLRGLLERLSAASLLHQTGPGTDPRWALSRLPEHVRVTDVLDALHGHAQKRAIDESGLSPIAVEQLRRLDEELLRSPDNRTLRELLAPASDPERQ